MVIWVGEIMDIYIFLLFLPIANVLYNYCALLLYNVYRSYFYFLKFIYVSFLSLKVL